MLASAQIENACDYIRPRVVRVLIEFNDVVKQSNRTEYGRGFIINGEYLATCYHLTHPGTNEKLVSVSVIYNEHETLAGVTYDQVKAFVDFKVNNGQYDFSNHKYDPANYETDFRILKLEHTIPNTVHVYSYDKLSYSSTVYCMGNVLKDNVMMNACQSSIYSFNQKQNPKQEADFLGCFSTFTRGCSGSPLYNSKNEIIGMVQFSWPYRPDDFMNQQSASGQMSKELYNKIVAAYNQGVNLQFSINIEFVISKYLKGYTN